jgi:hypothetical protein
MKDNIKINAARYRALSDIYRKKKEMPIRDKGQLSRIMKLSAEMARLELGDIFSKYMLPRIGEDIKHCESEIEKTI